MYEFDHYSFEQAALFIWKRSPTAKERHSDVPALVEWMKGLAVTEIKQPGYMGTLGFVIVACNRHGQEGLYFKATLDAGIANSML